jgi:alkanesulfonate monooxygenase SsuD/methylene tetrahydromethanopterin reductase-like flavin-dependent oxidoreductase (luciferase family)
MKFGIFDHIDRQDNIPIARTFEERLKLLAIADTKDFHAYHLAEHHHTPLGTVSSPSVFIAAASQRTKNIRLCPLVYLLTMYHPLRLIEEIAMLDHLTGGRFEFGVGKGVSPYELAFHGVPFLETQDIFDEVLEILMKGLTSDKLDHKGARYRFVQAPIEIHPLQKPVPPMWYGLSYMHTVPFVAERGYNVVSLFPPSVCKDLFAAYREQFADNTNHPSRQYSSTNDPFLGLYRLLYVAETDAEAERIARPSFDKWAQSFGKLWLDFGTLHVAMQGYEHAKEAGFFIVGSPESVREQIEAQADVCDPNYMIFSIAYGNMTHEEAKASLGLLTDEVMPMFK